MADTDRNYSFDLISESKFTLTHARTVDNQTLTDSTLTRPEQIPKYILQKLMLVDYRAREFKLKALTSNTTSNTYDSDDDDSEDEDEDEDDEDSDENSNEGINPMDGLLWVFHCSDIFLRRALAVKLSACQLSVPFLLPNPANPSENVTSLLSALESITKRWKSSISNQGDQEVFATEYPFPVVSFIRIGEVTMSKSLLINEIMSGGNVYHNFFFHRNMDGGDVKRKVVDGLVELCWFLPDGNQTFKSDNQTLNSEICFANLRGDAIRFEKQLNVLLKISSVLCILLNSGCPDKKVTTFLEKAVNTKANVILVFNEKRPKDAIKYFKDLRCERGLDVDSTKLSSITASTKQRYTFLQHIRRSIRTKIHEVRATPMVELESCLTQFSIKLDDDRSHFKFVKVIDSWMNLSIEEAENLLPLQTHVPVLADLEREKYSPKVHGENSKSVSTKRDIDEICKDIKAEKEAQKESFLQLDQRIIHFFNSIALMDKMDLNCALNGAKHQLDRMCLQIDAQKQEQESCPTRAGTQSSEQEHSKQVKDAITKYSFGLEHIIRELAQLYQLSDIVTNDYAGGAAEMLLSGQPLELLDGDSCYIPMKWFIAVYTKLESKTNNAKIFVISVLGSACSGKSTMLNTMFGLEFPVSAGRCTRGAFASLIPVSDSLKAASSYDYVLIIDTEGLQRSGDLQPREHDNELATFVIGVADVTIVNVMGENLNDVKEFLEIAVLAFLKMKLANRKKTCKIVYQNVLAADASEKLSKPRSSLKQELDKMTKVAAIQENCEDRYQKFDDVVSFDENKDVFYIPSLLNGSPPMAPFNPRYGEAIEDVKKNLIELMCLNERVRLSVSNFQKGVIELWTAIWKDNLLSFRNTIEVRAFTSLDRKYFEESVNLMVIGMAKLESEIQVALERCTTSEKRQEEWKSSEDSIRKEAHRLGEEMKKTMEKFFETSEDRATLDQWKENVMNRIVELKENQESEVNKTCKATFNFLQNQQDVEKMKL